MPTFEAPPDGLPQQPDTDASVDALFGLPGALRVRAYATRTEHVPQVDPHYRFHAELTAAILAGFEHNRRVLITGPHGSGKSSHVEQICARLNWPCMRVNLDGQVSRMDLLGRDVVLVRDGVACTEFREGILPWAVQRNVALVLDEYDAAGPELLFVLHRLLESDGQLALPDGARVLKPHPGFRIFATSNTLGLGNDTGLYGGTRMLNQAQLDRWSIVVEAAFLPEQDEAGVVNDSVPGIAALGGEDTATQMVRYAMLTREAYAAGDLSTFMSTRTLIFWAQNAITFGGVAVGWRMTFAARCNAEERPLLGEIYQRCFGVEP